MSEEMRYVISGLAGIGLGCVIVLAIILLVSFGLNALEGAILSLKNWAEIRFWNRRIRRRRKKMKKQ